MPSIKISTFGGLEPGVTEKLLPNNNAQVAHNTNLRNGRIRTMQKAYSVFDVSSGTSNDSDIAFSRDGLLVPPRASCKNLAYDRRLDDDQVLARIFYSRGSRLYYTSSSSGYAEYDAGIPIGPSIAVTLGAEPPEGTRTWRAYCATFVAGDEEGQPGQPVLIKCLDNQPVTVATSGAAPSGSYPPLKVRLYRSVTEFTSGEKLVNVMDTAWALVGEGNGPSAQVLDSLPAYSISGDSLLTREFYQFDDEDSTIVTLGVTESNHFYYVLANGTIGFSERHQFNAFPLRNRIRLPFEPVGAESFFDDVYVMNSIGSPARVRINPAPESGANIEVFLYPDTFPCVHKDTISKSTSGVVYASQQGIISVNGEGIRNLTAGLFKYDDFRMEEVKSGGWMNGFYICATDQNRFMIIDFADQTSGVNQLCKVWTADFGFSEAQIEANRIQFLPANGDMFIFLGSSIYRLDMYFTPSPTSEQNSLRWKWVSRLFTMPVPVNFAAARVTRGSKQENAQQDLTFRLYEVLPTGARVLRHESLRPSVILDEFRLPSGYKGLYYEIELEGRAWVDEVHLATSMMELRE
jgi:hypothetical protein